MGDFDRVILADSFEAAFIGQASREGLLTSGDKRLVRQFRRAHLKQDALTFLILFDKILIPDSRSDFRMPTLEDQNIVEFLPETLEGRQSEETFQHITTLRPLILNALMSDRDDDFWRLFSKVVGLSRRATYDAAIAYFVAVRNRDIRSIEQNRLAAVLPTETLSHLGEKAFEIADSDTLNPAHGLLFMAFLYARIIDEYRKSSEEYDAGVATRKYSGISDFAWSRVGAATEVSDITDNFNLVRCVFAEEGLAFPVVNTIQDAIVLRKDPNLRSFREQLAMFQSAIITGAKEDAIRLRREISRAKKGVAKLSKWSKALRMLTYFSLPANMIESIAVGAPIVGTTLSVFSAGATFAVERRRRKHSWIFVRWSLDIPDTNEAFSKRHC